MSYTKAHTNFLKPVDKHITRISCRDSNKSTNKATTQTSAHRLKCDIWARICMPTLRYTTEQTNFNQRVMPLIFRKATVSKEFEISWPFQSMKRWSPTSGKGCRNDIDGRRGQLIASWQNYRVFLKYCRQKPFDKNLVMPWKRVNTKQEQVPY